MSENSWDVHNFNRKIRLFFVEEKNSCIDNSLVQESGLFVWEMKNEHTVKLKPYYKGFGVLAKRFLLYFVSNRETLEIFQAEHKNNKKNYRVAVWKIYWHERGQRHTSWEWLIWIDIELEVQFKDEVMQLWNSRAALMEIKEKWWKLGGIHRS